MPLSTEREQAPTDAERRLEILDLIASLERSLAAADHLGLSTVGIRLDQALLALKRELPAEPGHVRGPTSLNESRKGYQA
ncbi:hypothetical protein GCM10009087_43930 [Sphingomonas oligophenolica]|uniref:Uncharacterized protein n=1 Tax=Sphingomonas oligophenolica TaxID=301154 RepID=A0ABU9XZW1_9SPHN